MPVKILMPALSPTMTEGTLASWKKKEGDKVKAGDVIAEIETDKATMEVEAVDEGTLGRILVAEGTENVAVNTMIAVLLEEGEEAAAIDGFVGGAGNAAAKPEAASPKAEPAKAETITAQSSSVRTSTPPAEMPKAGQRLLASPLARRIAAQNNLDLATVRGTGPHGRILRDDVNKALKDGPAGKPANAASASTRVSMPAGPGAKELADAYGMPYREEKVSGTRKVIAQRLTESKQTVPHFYLTTAVNIDKLLALRGDVNEAGDGKFKISVNDFVIKAAALALKKVPAANASWNGNSILYYDNVDISVAVATPNGLITPIIKVADTKSLSAISNDMKDLATRARDGKLKPQEYQGGTFSISNLGMFGVKQFEAIINPPQGCILAVGAGEATPVVIDGQIKIATIMHCTLSVDHRVVDGAVGAEYLQVLKNILEKPTLMLV